MGVQPRRKKGTPPQTAQRVGRSAARRGVPPTGIDRNPIPENSQRIRGSKELSGAGDTGAGRLPQMSGQGRDDPLGERPAGSQDG